MVKYQDREEADEETGIRFPEPFLWHVFECLCIAGLLMERGDIQRNPMSDWRTIVHRDLKQLNVFLSEPDRNRFHRYPTPKLGDFGHAIYEPVNEPFSYADRYTVDSHAIEQNSFVMDQIKEEYEGMPWPVSTKTNVWGVAFVVATMMLLRSTMKDILDYADGAREPTFDGGKESEYTSHLRDLLAECMQFDPTQRPSFAQILKTIQKPENRDAAGQDGMMNADEHVWESDEYPLHSLDEVCVD